MHAAEGLIIIIKNYRPSLRSLGAHCVQDSRYKNRMIKATDSGPLRCKSCALHSKGIGHKRECACLVRRNNHRKLPTPKFTSCQHGRQPSIGPENRPFRTSADVNFLPHRWAASGCSGHSVPRPVMRLVSTATMARDVRGAKGHYVSEGNGHLYKYPQMFRRKHLPFLGSAWTTHACHAVQILEKVLLSKFPVVCVMLWWNFKQNAIRDWDEE